MSYRNNRSRNSSDSRNRSFNNRNRSGGSFQQRPRKPVELHDVTCSKCGVETQVPFKPDGTRPVYCKECLQEQRSSRY